MKKCQTCSYENADTMRFCVECGSTLPDAPIVVNLGGGAAGQSNVNTAGYGNSAQTQAGGKGNFGGNFPNQFSNVPPSKPRSSKKAFLIIGGILAMLFLVFIAGAAIIGYNMMKDEVVTNPTPTNNPTPASSTTPTKATPKAPTPERTSSPEQTPTSGSDAKAELDSVWVDYNVTEKGRKGMRIHAKFTVRKMKNIDSYLAVYFEKSDGEKLYTKNKDYRSKDGQVAVFKALKPAYDDTIYEDEAVFIPYEEFNLEKGDYDLKADVDVIYKNGDLVEHMKFHEFEYTEP